MKLIFGSTAIKHWFPDYEKEPKDIDYLASEYPLDYLPNQHVEYHIPMTRAFYILLNHNKDNVYVDPNLLYTIKVSHMAWEGKNGKWWKHLKDIVFLQNKGCKLNREVFDAFYKEWQQRFGDKSHISLNKATEMFFKDGVRREYDHDWLHEYFKINGVPAYTRALLNAGTPLMSLQAFEGLERDEQLHCALEEMMVVAFERKTSLSSAYKSLITKQTKGWFNTFMIVNAENLLDGFEVEKERYKLLSSNLREKIL